VAPGGWYSSVITVDEEREQRMTSRRKEESGRERGEKTRCNWWRFGNGRLARYQGVSKALIKLPRSSKNGRERSKILILENKIG
jgi:hypothetical protein